MPRVAERWTQERRREHTRNLLLDAAEEVFVAKGFEGASLDEIAETAGYTRGAIYKHFAHKEDLFLAVNRRHNEQLLTGFLDLVETSGRPQDVDLAQIAKRWHELQHRDREFHAFGTEFSLYVLRNPEVRARVRAGMRMATPKRAACSSMNPAIIVATDNRCSATRARTSGLRRT